MAVKPAKVPLWERFLGALSSEAQQFMLDGGAAVVAASPDSEYAHWREHLPDQAAAVSRSSFGFCLVEAQEGELPVLRLFPTIEAMAHRLSDLEGQDMVVIPFWGAPLPITVPSPQRYVMHPDGYSAVAVPRAPATAVTFHVASKILDQVVIQEDGYLGPKELVQGLDPSRELEELEEDDQDEPAKPVTDDDADDD